MSGDIHKELVRLREDLSACLTETLPTREFEAALVLGTAWLGVLEARILETNNLEERRKLIHEFGSKRNTVCKCIELLRKKRGKGHTPSDEKLRCVLP
ncbi:MAG: hypothetical protein CVU57_23365 [Deltaproteobacteria bacterium HGW-Deltaproteobacteria-15]|jgi:hypothetical protein|nr:MAG: hypothetical protein CVU57_23365 [Deltaproteobacteria bacterium HGW-Deltaproteobacteria-15]